MTTVVVQEGETIRSLDSTAFVEGSDSEIFGMGWALSQSAEVPDVGFDNCLNQKVTPPFISWIRENNTAQGGARRRLAFSK